jgi:translation initiation factor IF-2
LEREERLKQASGRGIHARRAQESRAGGPRPVSTERKRKVQIEEPIQMRAFCEATGLPFQQVAGKLMRDHKVLTNITMTLSAELAELLALDFGLELEVIKARTAMERLREEFQQRPREHLEPRPPVVTILGHVDHGKTSILDQIRKSRVAKGEAGGITQHIGAYRFDKDGVHVTFLDTPGHEAFTAMRARGANLTDIVVLVVAADDGVMPQTLESINHAKAAGVPIVVALNKIDLPGVDVNRVYGQLSEHGLVPVEWGGDTEVVRTSAVTGEGLDKLLEFLSTFSELLELKADTSLPATGTVIEAEMKEGVGAVARVLVREGILSLGKIIVCGPGFGRVRMMTDDRGRRLKQATPGTPAEIAGMDEVPQAGDSFFVVDSLPKAKDIAEEIRAERRQESLFKFAKPKDIVALLQRRDQEEIPVLRLIIRADTHGSVDALQQALMDLPSEQVKLHILQASVGGITEGDVLLAEASDAVIIGFYVVADSKAAALAAQAGVDIRLHNVIYQVIDEIRQALEGMLAPESRLEVRGKAEVRDVFNISRVGTVAGCYVVDGLVARPHKVRVIRDNVVVFPRDEGRHAEMASLRRFKDDVREVRSGYECGIKIDGFDDVKPGDVIEAYEVVEVPGKL